MHIRCPHCDAEVREDVIFCPSCGGSIVPCEHVHQGSPSETLPLREVWPPALIASGNFADDEEITLKALLPADAVLDVLPEDEDMSPDPSMTSSLPSGAYASTWYKEVHSASGDTKPSYPPRSLPAPKKLWYRHVRPATFFWLSCLVILLLVLSGGFGVFSAFSAGNATMALQASPDVVAIGATITLRGTHFSPRSLVGLSLDHDIPVLDTAGKAVVQTDEKGNFTDTVVALADWRNGSHTLRAEDALTHKVVTVRLMVMGNGQTLRPAHLRISSEAFDFGAGDALVNGVKTLTLSNTGSGQINWQARSNQDWLKISPVSGTFVSGQDMQVFVAVDRSHAPKGTHKGQITFTSNAGSNVLTTRMETKDLRPLYMGALGATPPVLSFIASDGGPAPSPQDVALFNPGVSPLTWNASSDTNWLKVSPSANTLGPGDNQALRFTVDSHAMLPGIYHATVTIHGLGQDEQEAPGSPQKIFVTVTVTQNCLLQASPNALSFTGTYQGALPAAQTLKIGASHNCSGAVTWNVKSNANWLHVDASGGTTPSMPSVSVDTSSLAPETLPATYNAALLLSSATGTQTLPVSLTLEPAPAPVITLSTTHVSLTTTSGQNSPAHQNITLTNTGKGQLTWKATTATTSGGSWLSVSPNSGTLQAGASQQLSLSATPPGNAGPGSYSGTLTLTGTDSTGRSISGGTRAVPVNLTVRSSCDLSVGSNALSLTASANQPTAVTRSITLNAPETCDTDLAWHASVTSGANWLNVSDTDGILAPGDSDLLTLLATSSTLAPGTYRGNIAITRVDPETGRSLGVTHSISATFTVTAPCSIRATSPSQLNLTPQSASGQFSIVVSNTCAGNITFSRDISYSSGTDWLSITPQIASVTPGGTVTFTITADATALSAGTYTATIRFSAASSGSSINGNPLAVTVTFTVSDSTTPGSSPTP